MDYNGTYDSWYYAHPPVYMPLNCNLQDAIDIKPYTSKPIINAGRLQIDAAAEAIAAGKLDFCGMARQYLADEEFLTKIREDRPEDIRPCISCHAGCMPIGLWKGSGCQLGEVGACALNPFTRNEKKFAVIPTVNPKKIAVIGAGIAGMEFALQAAKRGHEVTLYEKSGRTGGVFNEAASFTFKEKDRDLLTFYKTQLDKSNVVLKTGVEVKSLDELEADEVVVATGSASPRRLSLPGAEKSYNAIDFLKDGMPCGDTVAIIGGGLTGCEIAYELALQGKHPIILEALADILMVRGSSMANTSFLRDAFDFYDVPIYTSAKVSEICDDGVKFTDEEGKEQFAACDTVVTSIGYINGTPFDTEKEHVHVIGDANRIANLYQAIKQANELVLELN